MAAENVTVFRRLYELLHLFVVQREVVLLLARQEVTSRYVGSVLGIVWSFIQPLVMIGVFWVVFSLGFKMQPLKNVPFVVWFTAGLSVWFVFSEMVTGGVGVFVMKAHLIKKTVFPVSILPVIPILASQMMHIVFLLVLILLMIFQQIGLSLYWLQFLYYLFAVSILGLGIVILVATLNVFIRDMAQIVGVILQVGFWATPIFWDVNMLPQHIQWMIKLNPMFYIVQGYRESFIYAIPFWHHPILTLYFWSVTGLIFGAGIFVYHRLKIQFAEVL